MVIYPEKTIFYFLGTVPKEIRPLLNLLCILKKRKNKSLIASYWSENTHNSGMKSFTQANKHHSQNGLASSTPIGIIVTYSHDFKFIQLPPAHFLEKETHTFKTLGGPHREHTGHCQGGTGTALSTELFLTAPERTLVLSDPLPNHQQEDGYLAEAHVAIVFFRSSGIFSWDLFFFF